MNIIKSLTRYFKSDFQFINKTKKNIGINLFHLGILFLASAPTISFLLLTIASIIGSLNRSDQYFMDKYNRPFIFASLLMITNCILIYIKADSFNILNPYLAWIGLLNWLPFFWCFWSFQIYLSNIQLRSQAAKYFLIGSFPVLFSGFTQYFLNWYGPYEFLNKLIIWYQRPLSEGSGITGLFNNYNYAGSWLSITLPLIVGFLIKKEKKMNIRLINLIVVFLFIYMIILTTSRNALLSAIFTLFLIIPINKFRFYFIFLFVGLGIFLTNFFSNSSLNFHNKIYNFLPSSLFDKLSLNNLSDISSFPRVELWIKTIDLIKSNLLIGYGGGSFSNLYILSNGEFEGMQHSHNLILEIAFNYGLPSSILIITGMIYIFFKSTKRFSLNNFKDRITINNFNQFDEAWISSFIIFFFMHMLDITYFDGRISLLIWIILAGMRQIIREKQI